MVVHVQSNLYKLLSTIHTLYLLIFILMSLILPKFFFEICFLIFTNLSNSFTSILICVTRKYIQYFVTTLFHLVDLPVFCYCFHHLIKLVCFMYLFSRQIIFSLEDYGVQCLIIFSWPSSNRHVCVGLGVE